MTDPVPDHPVVEPSGHDPADNPSIDTLLILGASGDLTGRLLLPAIGQLLTSPEGPERLSIVGAGAEPWDADHWRQRVTESFSSVKASGERVEDVLAQSVYLQADVTAEADLRRLLEACEGVPAIYFALPPAVTAKACAALRGSRAAGGDRAGAREAVRHRRAERVRAQRPAGAAGARGAVHRVDHFLGKSTVLNLLGRALRQPAASSRCWRAEHIERVEIVFDETLGLEGRAGTTTGAGALIDMIQSHLLQVLALVAMEPPSAVARPGPARREGAGAARHPAVGRRAGDARAGAPATPPARSTGGSCPRTPTSRASTPSRETETLAEVTVAVDTWRWAGVPFRCARARRSGHAARRSSSRSGRCRTCRPGFAVAPEPTRLRLVDRARIGCSIDLNINGPDDPFDLDRVTLHAEFAPGGSPPTARCSPASSTGDPTLSVRGDIAEECWRIVEPVLRAWREGTVPLEEYPAGSAGPAGWDDPTGPPLPA